MVKDISQPSLVVSEIESVCSMSEWNELSFVAFVVVVVVVVVVNRQMNFVENNHYHYRISGKKITTSNIKCYDKYIIILY